MNRNHISNEILIAWIEKPLSKSEYQNVSDHLENCDKCYLRYSTILESVMASKSAKPKEVPNEITQFAKERLGIADTITSKQSGKISILNKLKNIGRKIPIFRPIPVTAILVSVALLLIILNLPVEIKKPSTFITTSKSTSPVSVKIENDSLIISQSIKVNNSILITSVVDDTLFAGEFSGLQTVLSLSKFERQEKIQIFVKSYGVSIVDTTITIR